MTINQSEVSSTTMYKRKNSDGEGIARKRLITDFFGPKTIDGKKVSAQDAQVSIEIIDTKEFKNQESKEIKESNEIEIKETKEFKESKQDDEVEKTRAHQSLAPEVSLKGSVGIDGRSEDKSIESTNGFDKDVWVNSLSAEHRELLKLEINTLHVSWLAYLHQELTKPYFIALKKFLKSQESKTVFPKPQDIYSWSHFTPLPNIKCLILGQDPYHNHNQAHGLAFSVLEPTRPPPSLVNIYKTIKIDYPDFKIPDYKELARAGKPGGGNLTKWAKQGVLMLNAVLTVEAHHANSHAKRGWETFTEHVIKVALEYHKSTHGFVIMAWGTPAQTRISRVDARLAQNTNFLVLSTVHPSPLSARRGFFESQVFKKCNQWLESKGTSTIDWKVVE